MYPYTRTGKSKTLHLPSSDYVGGTIRWQLLAYSPKVHPKFYPKTLEDLYHCGVKNSNEVAPQVAGIYRITWDCNEGTMFEVIRILSDHNRQKKGAVRPPKEVKQAKHSRKLKKNQLETAPAPPAEQVYMPPPAMPFAHVQGWHTPTVVPQTFPSSTNVGRGYTAEGVDPSAVDLQAVHSGANVEGQYTPTGSSDQDCDEPRSESEDYSYDSGSSTLSNESGVPSDGCGVQYEDNEWLGTTTVDNSLEAWDLPAY